MSISEDWDAIIERLTAAIDEMKKLHAEQVRLLTAERDAWKANHDNQVLLKRLLTVRNDLPPDRVALAEQISRLENERDRAFITAIRMASQVGETYEPHCETCPRGVAAAILHLLTKMP